MAKTNFILNDHYEDWVNLNPLTLTKPISKLRVGITTIEEKWAFYLKQSTQVKTCQNYLASWNTFEQKVGEIYFFINATYIPNEELKEAILALETGESLYENGHLIASKIKLGEASFEKEVSYQKQITKISFPWDLFQMNDVILKQDFENLTKGRNSQELSSSNIVIGDKSALFLEEGAQVEGAILNTKSGPIYLAKNAEIMESSVVRGSLALCESATLKLATKIYGATTIGPHCKVGGEVNNSVLQGFSNKGHDGFLGNSVIGEWCNLGADTNNSNLKNNYGIVKAYNYNKKDFIDSGQQFLGLIMGDHSKCGINTMFNTGTVVGVFANIFGGDFPPKHIPSFAWGGSDGFTSYNLDKAFEVAQKVMERRKINLSENDKDILKFIYKNNPK